MLNRMNNSDCPIKAAKDELELVNDLKIVLDDLAITMVNKVLTHKVKVNNPLRGELKL